MEPSDHLEAGFAGHALLLDTVRGLDEHAIRDPSLLPAGASDRPPRAQEPVAVGVFVGASLGEVRLQ